MINRFFIWIVVVALPCLGGAGIAAAETGNVDITQLPIEQLVETDFIPASRIARQISDAPSAVSIVTTQDIRDYGYRTLSDILKSMRGLYVTTSLDYDFLGGRGFGAPGDYAGRIMLMIDGYATNDNIFNQIFLSGDSLLDVEMIERVEFIPGPGSTTYGNSAFLGVINIVTKSGKDFGGAQASVGFGAKSANKERLTYGKQLDNGAEVLASVSMYGDSGRAIRFSALDGVDNLYGDPFTNQTLAHMRETSNRRLFFKGGYEGWSVELAHTRQMRRNDGLLGDFYPSDIGESVNEVDDNGFASLKYDADLGESLKSSTHVYYGQYLYRSINPAGTDTFQQRSTGRWWGGDNKFVGTWFDGHQILFGGEFRNDYQQELSDSWYTNGPGVGFDTGMRTFSLYAQDEYSLTEKLTLTPGMRYDNNSVGGDALSPRIAAIYHPWQASTFKLSYGKAFRYANIWEQYNTDINNFDAGNPARTGPINPESVSTTELVWQQQFTSKSRLTVSLYSNRITDVVRKSFTDLDTTGQEVGIEHVGETGFRLNASVAHQTTEDNFGNWMANSPHWLGKLNIARALFQNRATAGFEVQTTGRRLDRSGAIVSADTVANLTLGSSRLLPNTNVSLNIRNLFNEHLEDVLQSRTLRTMPLEGRNLWLQLEYDLK